jgi:hypothetical protein
VTAAVVKVAALGAAVFVGGFATAVGVATAGAVVARRLARALDRSVDPVELDEALGGWPDGWWR